MKLMTGIFFLFTLQFFIIKPMEEDIFMMELEPEQSELDKVKCEVRKLLVRLEKKDKKLFTKLLDKGYMVTKQSVAIQGYRARMMSAYDNLDSLQALKKNILQRIEAVAYECYELDNNIYEYNFRISVQDILKKWLGCRIYIVHNASLLNRHGAAEWLSRIDEIKNDFKVKARYLNNHEINMKLNNLMQNFIIALGID